MRRASRQLLALAALAAGLGIAAWAQIRHEESQWEPPLTALVPGSISRIALDCPSCVSQRYERVGDHWRMREPRQQDADASVIEHLLAIAQAAVRSRRPLEGLDPIKLGLQPAQATLRFDDVSIAFGHLDSIDGDRYVRIGGEDRIALVPDRFSQYLFAPPQ